MAGKKGNPPKMGENQAKDLAGALLKMAAVGFAGGIALISCAKKVGDALFPEDTAGGYEDDDYEE